MIASKPLVTNPSAHTELPANCCKRLLVLLSRDHKAHPLIHRTGLRPSHRQGPPCRSVDLLPMSPVYSVTYVAGQDRGGLVSAPERSNAPNPKLQIRGKPSL